MNGVLLNSRTGRPEGRASLPARGSEVLWSAAIEREAALSRTRDLLLRAEQFPNFVATTTTRRYLCTPAAAAGLTFTKSTTAWNAATGWTQILAAAVIPDPSYISGFTIQYHNTPLVTVDTTFELEMQIATGAAASEVMKIQYPFNIRVDSAVGHQPVIQLDLPEPFTLTGSPRLAFRILGSGTIGLVFQGIKFIYQTT